MIKHENNQYCVYNASGTEKLGCHPTKSEADKHLAAIEAHKAQDRREVDINGYWKVPENPISKVGVYPYLGREIGAPDPDRIYHVYRPAEELGHPDTVASFNLLPLIDEHEFLGAGGSRPEDKGVQGTTGEGAKFEHPYLRNNLRVYSTYMQELINSGKTELSPAYRCDYDFTPGVFEGQQYDAVQRNIRGNHLALVAQGRTGPDVAVMDSYLITCDSAEYIMTPEMIEQIKALIAQVLAEQAAGAAGDESTDPEKNEDEEVEIVTTGEKDAVETVVEEAETAIEAVEEAAEAVEEAVEALEAVEEAAAEVEAAPTADSIAKLKKAIDRMKKRSAVKIGADSIASIRKAIKRKPAQTIRTKSKAADSLVKLLQAHQQPALDSATVIRQIAARDELAKRLQPHIGTFDTGTMVSMHDVAKYGIKKLGIKAADGAEVAVLEGYLQAAKPDTIVSDAATVRATDTASKIWKEQ